MMKVKRVRIFNSWRCKFNVRPAKYCFVVEIEGLDITGEVEINFVTEQLIVSFDTESLNRITISIVEDEVIRLAILKEIFYRFCVKSNEPIERFTFVYQGDEHFKSIIESVLFYEPILYNEKLKSERVLHAIVKGYKYVKSIQNQKTTVHLDAMTDLKDREKRKAFDILKRYLKSIDDKGVLQYVDVGYDGQTSILYMGANYSSSKYR